jgi:hypothetical protein
MSHAAGFVPIYYSWGWPGAFPIPSDGPGADLLHRVSVSGLTTGYDPDDGSAVVSMEVTVLGMAELALPLLSGFSAALGSTTGTTAFRAELHSSEGTRSLKLSAVSISLRLPSDLFNAVHEEDGAYVVDKNADGTNAQYEIKLDGIDVEVDSIGNMTISSVASAPSLSLSPVMIGDTGIVISADDVHLFLGADDALPSAAPAGFKGLYLDSARVYLPAELKDLIADEVAFKDCYIGSDGFTGSVSFSGSKAATLFGFTFTLTSVELSFIQNAIVKGAISGRLTIPFFDEEVNVALSLSSDGGFGITLTDGDGNGVFALTLDGIGTLSLTSLGFSVEDGEATLSLSGTLSLTLADLDWPDVKIQNLRISSDGEVQIDGGWLDLQEPLSLDLYGFRMEISRVGFGNEPADDGAPARRSIGFSGGISFPDPVSLAASVDGLRVSWDPANPSASPEISLEGLGLEFTIPSVLTLAGSVSLVNEGGTHLFRGSAKVELLPLAISLDASLMIGEITEDSGLTYKVLYVYLGVEQRVGIPIFATGAAVYGFAGLFGSNVAPNRDGSDWYSWYATQDPVFNLTEPAKWKGQADAIAVGTGVTVGSLFDGGWAISTKGSLIVLIPGPAIMLETKVNLCSDPPLLTNNSSQGIFNALTVIDAAAGYFQLNIDAPLDVKKIINISASAEAYAEVADPSAAHVYIGEKPTDRRIRADVLSLFSADAYYMLESGGIEAGFGASLGDSWKFGPVRLTLEAWLAAEARVSWRPPQLAGSIGLGGQFLVSVANFDCGISAEATLAAKAAAPFLVEGSVTVQFNLPWPCDDLDFTFALSWEKDDTPPMETPLESVSAEHMKVSETWPLALIESDLSPGSATAPPLVPLDAKLVLVFNRLVDLPTELGLTTLPRNTPVEIGDYTFSYELVSVKLERCSKFYGDSWEEVALDPAQSSWAAIDDGSGSSSKMCLYLGVATPFAFTRFSSRTSVDSFLERHPGWPCIDPRPAPEVCATWEAEDVGEYGPFLTEDLFTFVSPTRVTRNVADYGGGTVNLLQLDAISDTDVAAEPIVLCIAPPFPAARLKLKFLLVIGETTISTYSKGVLSAEFTLPDLFEEVYDDFLEAGGTVENPQAIYGGEFEIEGESIDWIKVDTSLTSGETVFKDSKGLVASQAYPATLLLISVCAVSQSSEDAAQAQQERLESLESSATAWSTTDPVFEPESYYRLVIQTRTIREKNGNEEDDPYTHYAYFQTGGPPGILPFAPSTEESAADTEAATTYPTGGGLANLSPYIRWTIPSDGELGVYCAYDQGVEYNENYVEPMFGADMGIRLLDRNARPLTDADGNEILLENQWGKSTVTQLSTMEVAYVSAYEKCLRTSELGFIADQTITAATSSLLLDEFDTATGLWTAVDEGTTGTSSWAVTSGHLVQSGTVHDATTTNPSPAERLGTLYIAGDQSWTDYAFEVDITSDDAAIGLVFRYTETEGSPRYYRLSLDRNWGYRRLVRMDAGAATVLWERTSYRATASGVAVPMAPEAYEPGQKFTLAVQCAGRRLRGQLNDELLFDLEDSADGALPQGCVALYAWNNPSAVFERALVRTWPGALLDPLTQYTAELLGSHVLFNEALAPSWSTDSLESIDIGNAALVGESWWADYRLVTNLQLADDLGGVVIRYDAAGDHCRFVLDTDRSWELILRSSGTDRVVASGQLSSASSEVSVSLGCVGDTVELQISDAVAYTGTVAGLPESGTAGLFSEGTDTPHSDLMVLSAPRQAVHSWTIFSSSFANFVDHMDSFDGAVYDAAPSALSADGLTVLVEDLIPAGRAELSRLEDDLASARQDLEAAAATEQETQRTVVQSAIDALYAESWQTYDELFALLFGEGAYRPLPPVVEISQIVSEGARLGILLESPQPIHWTRIDWELRRLGTTAFSVVNELLLCWSEDQTRALLLADGAGGLADGSYELRMTFHLDRGLESPVLRNGGSTLPETAMLTFILV